MQKEIIISIGALADPVWKQLKSQGVVVAASDVSHFQRAHNGLVQLICLGCISDKEMQKISQRLTNKIGLWAKNKMKNYPQSHK